MPNQNKVAAHAIAVTYHDNIPNVRVILLPNWDLMQAHPTPEMDNSFCMQMKQEWESRNFKMELFLKWH